MLVSHICSKITTCSHIFYELTIDVSIWLHQSVKGYRDREGRSVPNAHLLGVFHRVCKLLSYGIKPIFVFDGGVPVLKRQTINLRKQRKIEAHDKSEMTRNRLLSNLLRQQIQRQLKTTVSSAALDEEIDRIMEKMGTTNSQKRSSPSSASSSQSPSKSSKSNKSTWSPLKSKGDLEFEDDFEKFREKLAENFNNFSIFFNELDATQGSVSDDEDSEYGTSYGCNYDEHFSNIVSSTFDELPLETQHEMLFEMQESKKNNSWGKIDQMPKELQSFSSFQMDRLRKRWTLQKKIQTVQKEMGHRHIHLSNFDDLAAYNYDNIPDANTNEVLASQAKGMIFVRGSTIGNNSQSVESETNSPDIKNTEPVPGPSSALTKGKDDKDKITIDDYIVEWSSSDEDQDKEDDRKDLTEEQELEKALKLSLATEKEKEQDDVEIIDGPQTSLSISSNVEEIQQITPKQNSNYVDNAKDPIEEEQLQQAIKLSLATDNGDETPVNVEDKTGSSNAIIFSSPSEIQSQGSSNKEVEEVTIHSDSSTDDEDDFEDVVEEEINEEITATIPQAVNKQVPVVQIQLDLTKSLPIEENDIFADIFKNPVFNKSDNNDKDNSREEKTEELPLKKFIAENSKELTEESKVTERECDWIASEGNSEKDDDVEMIGVGLPQASTINSNDKYQQITRTLGQDPTKSTHMITTEYLQNQQKLRAENKKLQSSRGAQERIATTITDQMYAEAQELLALFGVPYIVSPMEAESQCAFLDTACLTDGSITDDSDIWLFGAQRVYKNFFSTGERPLEFFQYADIVKKLNLDREKLVLLAILTGSDYTDGVEGVGPVKALEIISEFTNPAIIDTFDILVKFREWWEKARDDKKIDAGNKIRDKFRKIKLRPGFPSRPVYDAYLEPTIDTSTEEFRWGSPDLDALRAYTRGKFGWNEKKSDANLLPLLKNLRCQAEQTSRQLTMDRFLTSVGVGSSSKRKIKSKRLEVAMKKLKNIGGEAKLSSEESEEEEDLESSGSDKELDGLLEKMGVKKVKFTRKDTAGRAASSQLPLSIPAGIGAAATRQRGRGGKLQRKPRATPEEAEVFPPSSAMVAPKKTVPTTTVIPQKARAEFQKQMNKKKAIELFQKKKEEKN